MKKLFLSALIGFSSLAFCNDYQIRPLDDPYIADFILKVKNISDNKSNQLAYIFEKWNPNDIVYLKKGTKLPLNIFLKGEYFYLKNDLSEISFEKDLYLRMADNNLFFSDDLQNWKTALEFFTGNCLLELAVSDKNDLQLEMGAELNKK